MIEQAIDLAVRSHKGQVDKAGAPYILHPLRVLGAVGLVDDDIMCAAVLHDVVEDCGVTLNDLRKQGFTSRTVNLVRFLTRLEDETYDQFIDRLSRDKHASWIKVCDLRDNQNLARMGVADPRELTEAQFDRTAKYYRAEVKLREKWGFK